MLDVKVLVYLETFDGTSQLEDLPSTSRTVLLLVADVLGQRSKDSLAAVLAGDVAVTFENLKILQNLSDNKELISLKFQESKL